MPRIWRRLLEHAVSLFRRQAARASQAPGDAASSILVVDDQRSNRTLLLLQLRQLGYTAEAAGSAAEAQDKWRTGCYRIIITDCHMSGQNGYDLTRAIRRAEARKHRPRTAIIGWTASERPEDMQACLVAGMDACLPKAVETEALVGLLSNWQLPPRMAAIPRTSTASNASSEHVVFDRSVLARYAAGDAQAEQDILRDYRSAKVVELETVRGALAERDATTLRHSCHRLKGSSRIVGAHAFAAVCERLEQHAGSANWEAIEASVELFFAESKRLTETLDAC